MWSPTHVQVTVQRAKGLLIKGKKKTNDCFVTIALGKEKYQTSVKEKATENVEWHEECELQIPHQGNTAEIVLTALHRNFLGVDEFLGTISVPLSSFDVYERPRNRWYKLGHKPGKENNKERGELEVKIAFIVKAGSLTDLTRKERYKSSLGQLSTAAQSIGGSLLSIGSLEKRKGLKKFAKSIGKHVKGRNKTTLDKDGLEETDEVHIGPSTQARGEADPGVISEDEDEFTFDDLSHKSSASSLNAPAAITSPGSPLHSSTIATKTNFTPHIMPESPTTPPVPTNAAPSKPPRFSSNSPNSTSMTNDNQEDEWGCKLYGKQPNSILKRWDTNKLSPRITIDEPREESDESLTASPEPSSREPHKTVIPKRQKVGKLPPKDDSPQDDRKISREKSPKSEKIAKKDKKKEKDQRFKDIMEEGHSSSERIIIGGEDSMKNSISSKCRLPHEVLAQFEGKSREDLIELTLQLQSEVIDKKKRLADLEDYIDALLLRVIECSPRLLQSPYQPRRLSSPGRQC